VTVTFPVAGAEVVGAAHSQLNTCAHLGDGSVWCWGDNQEQVLGATAGPQSSVPLKVDVPCQ
jgi:hypothetical protein